ncbi:phage tail tape measure protein [Methylophaga sp. OBS4]|uniref:phage tail tape measure protein n=1 Tax=Methylophaga sp. OBS4 TaxID=2991935 RepID=UPI00224F8C78|nr:phage tail tape measure protein [Methylophaga sp. OBS4]MCX4187164.1 phage tail tape measure protein [Methylophaga sp. OBS4]
MATAMQNLDFMISLIDRVSGPAGKIMKTMDTVTTNVQAGYRQIGYGAAGMVGASFALDRFLQPAKAMDRALGEVASLGVANDVLTDLTKTSLRFSTQYGESADEFVRSSYDIQSAIAGLQGKELAKFTEASAVLAKGTKAQTSTITSYMGTMYGIFKQNADQMGKGEWVQMLAGQTAAAVQIFKTTGSQMSEAFSRIGAEAQSHGVAMNEQIAVLGSLQATMTGSEAGTKYKAFLAGVGKAQETLGLQFTDSQGRMLPMVQILDKIQGKFGEIDTVAESDMLQKAFGTKEAVALVKLLSSDITGLNNNISQIGQQTGMDKAIKMAEAITDPWEKAGEQMRAIQTVLGKALMPQLLPFLSMMGEGANKILRWTELFPNLTKWVGIGILSIIGLVAATSVLSLVMGTSKLFMVAWTVSLLVLKGAFVATKFSLLTMIPAVWGFTAALLANPITWVVLGITALIAAVVAAVVYWDVWTGKIVEWTSRWWEFIGLFSLVDGVLAAWDKLPQWWASFKNWLGTLDPFSFIGTSLDWLTDKIGGFADWLGLDLNIGGNTPAPPKPVAAPASMLANSQSAQQGGVIQRINQANNQRSSQMGDVVVNNYGPSVDGNSLMADLEFMGG